MLKIIYEVLFLLNDVTNMVISILSIVATLFSILILIREKSKKVHESTFIWKVILIVGIIVFVGTKIRDNLVKVPDVVGCTYQNACNMLGSIGLKYSKIVDNDYYIAQQSPMAGEIVTKGTNIELTIEEINNVQVPNVVGYTYQNACYILSNYGLKYNLIADKGEYVVEQSLIEGTSVEKGTEIELITRPIGDNAEVRSKLEQALEVEYGNVEITFEDTNLSVTKDGEVLKCTGTKIHDFEVLEAYFIEEKSGVEYHDYTIKDGIMIFNNIPIGIEFKFYILLKGYEERKENIVLKSQYMQEDKLDIRVYMTKFNAKRMSPATFYVADAQSSTPRNVNYMSDVKMWILWPNTSSWCTNYKTNEDGEFEYQININKEQKIRVKISNPFGNGNDYECEVTLRELEVGFSMNSDIIFLNEDGTCEVISQSEYFMR
ncbi:MAG: PASTA domain-containing protein [Lachnospiraceae bacterium]